MRCTLKYDANKLPYLGVWITAGGYRGDYNCALEPATGFYDDVPRTIKNGTIRVLEPGGEFAFTLEISLRKEKQKWNTVKQRYRAVFLENDYLKIMVLPELGGRIQRATDKTNNYDFVYYNHVIKPALVGLAGPWISGGIEFNWPQHHRPSTYDPVSFHMQENEDGSATVMVGEAENMFRTKGNAYFTLYPDKAWLEIRAQLYNRTSVPQTFLWWANPAVPVNDNTQSVFPPDVHAVMDHGKRDVSRFPIATGTYYKMDYSAGVDISRYKNIPVPTSYMACHSDYDFVGGYDYGKEAGILHIADHHIAPGKKQWTWGCGEFGQAWDRNLTDEDGPYVELMTGCFTDNQPDFSWLAPYEEKTFTQYFMPYKGVGMVKNATLDAAVGLETEGGNAVVTVYTMGEEQVKIRLTRREQILFEEDAQLDPGLHYMKEVKLPEDIREEELLVQVISEEGKELVSYRPKKEEVVKIPEPARAAPAPEDAASCEDLYLYGLDGSDIRLNNAYGKLLFNRGLFAESEPYFRRAVEKQLRSNPNPYDGEPLYQLGLSLKFQGKMQEAYDAFYKATWNGAWQDAAFYQLACIDCAGGDFAAALSHIERSLVRNYHNIKARNLKSCLLRKMGRTEEAKAWTFSTIAIDGLDANSRREPLVYYNKKQIRRLLPWRRHIRLIPGIPVCSWSWISFIKRLAEALRKGRRCWRRIWNRPRTGMICMWNISLC